VLSDVTRDVGAAATSVYASDAALWLPPTSGFASTSGASDA
jgi:hypothetical protein